MRLILDNLPITTYDLEENPESIRPGYEVGYKGEGGQYYLNNHLMFKILVHRTHGQYSRVARRGHGRARGGACPPPVRRG